MLSRVICTARLVGRVPIARTMSVYKGGIPTKDELATGMERVQLEAFKEGVADPFDREVKHLRDMPAGTGQSKNNPIKVANLGHHDRRIVTCKCERSEHQLTYMQIYLGDAPKRCECGLWFQLEKTLSPAERWVPEEVKSAPKTEISGH